MTNNKNHKQQHNITNTDNNLKQWLILKTDKKKVINDASKIHNFIIANVIMNGTNDGIKHRNENMNFMNVLKKIFYNCNCTVNLTNWYYFEILIILSSIFCHILSFDLTQQRVYRKGSVRTRTRIKTIQEKCKDNENNQNNRGGIADLVSDDARYFSSYVLIFSSINTLLKALNIFLDRVEYDESASVKIVDYANIFTIIVNGYDAVQFVVLKLNVLVTSITNKIIDALRLLLIQIFAKMKTAHTLYSMHHYEAIFWLLSFKSTLLQDCAKQSFVGANLWIVNKATFNIFKSIHMILIMIKITVRHNNKNVFFYFSYSVYCIICIWYHKEQKCNIYFIFLCCLLLVS